MCIAILKTKEGIITDDALRNSFNNNKDGRGIAFTINNQLYYVKGIFDVNTFIETVRKYEKLCDNNMLIHCRISTGGNIDKANCHPHVINNTCVMIHNGIIHDLPIEKDNSDTVIYCRDILSKFSTDDLMHNKALHRLIIKDIGSYNKFVFLNNLGEYTILNEKCGVWDNGVWYSNTSYKPRTIYKYETASEKKNKYNPNTLYKNDYSDYDYNDWYSNYLTNSKGTNDLKDDFSILNHDEYLKVKDFIDKLDAKQVLDIGTNPVVDINSLQVLKKGNFEDINTLQELDEDLYTLYLEKINDLATLDEELLDKLDAIAELQSIPSFQDEIDFLEVEDFLYIGTVNVKFDVTAYFNTTKGILLKDYSPKMQEMFEQRAKDLGLVIGEDGSISKADTVGEVA